MNFSSKKKYEFKNINNHNIYFIYEMNKLIDWLVNKPKLIGRVNYLI